MADIIFPGEAPGGTLGIEFMPANYNIVLYRGDFLPMTVVLKDNNGVVLNLTGSEAKASIRQSFSSPQSYDFSVTLTPLEGKIDLKLTSAVSSTIEAGDYIWDFQVTDASGNTRTYIAGDVHIYDEVTK